MSMIFALILWVAAAVALNVLWTSCSNWLRTYRETKGTI